MLIFVNETVDMHMKIHEDNARALALAKCGMTPCSKHYVIKYDWFCKHIRPRKSQLVKISSKNQLGDLFTKGLRRVKFSRLQKRLTGKVTPISREALLRGSIAGILPTTQPLYLPLSFEIHLPTYISTYTLYYKVTATSTSTHDNLPSGRRPSQ
jgi:hypothetical protein